MVGQTAQTGFVTSGRDCYLDDPKNVAVSSGSLHLTSRVESESFMCKSPYGDFSTNITAGTVLSYGKFAQTYGRFEFRAKFPSTAGATLDSALWMYPQDPAYGGWPNSGEIDIAEWFGDPYADHVVPSVHYAGENRALTSGRNCVVPNADSEFHNYAVEWTATEMSFYYDNTMCFQHAWTSSAPLLAGQPFDQAFDLVMTQTGPWGVPIVGKTYTMDIDWVRAWK